MSKAIKTGLMALIMLVFISTGLFAAQDTGVPIFYIGVPGTGAVAVALDGAAANESARCGQGSYLPSFMSLDTSSENGKQLFSMLLSANLAGKQVIINYDFNATNNACTLIGAMLRR